MATANTHRGRQVADVGHSVNIATGVSSHEHEGCACIMLMVLPTLAVFAYLLYSLSHY